MNPPSDPSTPEPSAPQPRAIEIALQKPAAQPPPEQPRATPQPVPPDAGPGLLLDSLLKRPAQLVQAVCEGRNSRIWLLFLPVALGAFAFYGLVVGSFSGGAQYMVSPLKISVGELLCLLICFPSFYIFASLSGIEVSLRALAGVFLSMFALTGLLLLGFAPVAWVFSQSTESTNFIGAMHLVFWLIATIFGLRLFHYMTVASNAAERVHLKVWTLIFVLVSLQMTTALRPIIGASNQLLPVEKKFFVTYWMDNLHVDPPPAQM